MGAGCPTLRLPLGSGPLAEDFLTGSHCLLLPHNHSGPHTLSLLMSESYTEETGLGPQSNVWPPEAGEQGCVLMRWTWPCFGGVKSPHFTVVPSKGHRRLEAATQSSGRSPNVPESLQLDCSLARRPCSTCSSHAVSPGECPEHCDPQVCHL